MHAVLSHLSIRSASAIRFAAARPHMRLAMREQSVL